MWPFLDMVKLTFNDDSCAKFITLVLYDMMNPLILKTIEASVTATIEAAVKLVQDKIIDQMRESNRKSQESIGEQSRIVQEQRMVIENQDQVIADQNKVFEAQSKLLKEKDESIENFEMQVYC